MTQEEKQLLFEVLSAILPYRVVVATTNPAVQLGVVSGVSIKGKITVSNKHADIVFDCTEVKPYLRPLYSMTDEERKEYKRLVVFSSSPGGAAMFIKWLNFNHFDYQGLLEMGLAIEAPEGMYK